jgi:hypothetical protein
LQGFAGNEAKNVLGCCSRSEEDAPVTERSQYVLETLGEAGISLITAVGCAATFEQGDKYG